VTTPVPRLPDYRVVMVEPSFEESIGFLARAMKNFGLHSLRLVNPRISLGSNGRSRGGHAQEILDTITTHTSLQEALRGLDLSIGTTAQRGHSSANLLRKPMTPRELGIALTAQSGEVGIVFGREGTGLNNHELSLCDTIVTIPAADAYPTLNLSHAAAIIFYELYQSRTPAAETDLASEDVRRTILGYLSESLSQVGLEEYRIGLTVRAFRSIMGRSAIRRREGSLLAGGFRQISEALSTSQRITLQTSGIDQVKLPLEE
jgi:tRNA/rRNA methyltransferase